MLLEEGENSVLFQHNCTPVDYVLWISEDNNGVWDDETRWWTGWLPTCRYNVFIPNTAFILIPSNTIAECKSVFLFSQSECEVEGELIIKACN